MKQSKNSFRTNFILYISFIMPFEAVLTQIFETGLESFNEADYEKLNYLIVPHAQLISPEVNLPKIQAPAVHLKSFNEIIQYWSVINENYENRITKYEYIAVGKISIVRCYYERIDMIIDTEIHFDNYAKIIKMVNQLVEEE